MERNLDAERIRRFHIEHELELRRAHDRKVGWALALEHTAGDAAELLVAVDEAGAVADETARDGKFADVVDRRYAMPPSERDERVALTVEKRIALDDESASPLIAKSSRRPPRSRVRSSTAARRDAARSLAPRRGPPPHGFRRSGCRG